MKKATAILAMVLFLWAAQACTQSRSVETLSVIQFAEKMENEPGIIIDVRTPEEYAQGHLANALLMNIYDTDFEERIKQLDPKKTYYVYCRSGGRSMQAAKLMEKLGFERVYNLAGGIVAWHAAQRTIVREAQSQASDCPNCPR